MSDSCLLVTDTPSIKQFVFGTDTLAETRGASAILDRLNRCDTENTLRTYVSAAGGQVRKVYANGGSGQFLIHGCARDVVRGAMVALNTFYRKETGGEVKLAFGIAPLRQPSDYEAAVRSAHFQMRSQREMATSFRATPLLPFIMECESSSHLPAASRVPRSHAESLLLSDTSRKKREASRKTRKFGVWREWMCHLAKVAPWPEDERWGSLRCDDFTGIGEHSQRTGYVGLVYADGNAMGRLVQELDGPETTEAFSDIVDSSIREACFEGLDAACQATIEEIRKRHASGANCPPLPADILMLGGDDLLVLVPADRALSFALDIAQSFEQLTKQKIAAIPAEARRFFDSRLGGNGLTVSCGVAISTADYPFYLLLDLAEALLKNAKEAGSRGTQRTGGYWVPSYVDFHLVAGASSHELNYVRTEDYLVKDGAAPRTLRPMAREQLLRLRDAVGLLRGFPRSKLHDLWAASVHPSRAQSELLVREVFSRCKQDERAALWRAVELLCPTGHQFAFPWYERGDSRTSAVADLVEASFLFSQK